jgi:hypothetical protein
MSIIVAPRLFPNRQLEEFIQSTRHIKAEYEIIIVASTKQSMQLNKENLQSILDASTQCSRATIITLDEDPDSRRQETSALQQQNQANSSSRRRHNPHPRHNTHDRQT